MMKSLVSLFLALLVMTPARGAPDAAPDPQYERVIADVRESCGGIVERLNKIKTMAGINTVVTGVGTLAGGGALYAGISKNSIDKQAAELERQMDAIENMSDKEFLAFLKNAAEYQKSLEMYQNICSQKKALDEKSKQLGNVRTGLMAGNTATAVAGTVIANKNKNDGKNIVQHVSDCLAAVEKTSRPMGQARINGDEYRYAKLKKISDSCGRMYTNNLEKIPNNSNVAMISSAVNIGTGIAGTITSAIANTDATRGNKTEAGRTKEKNLNTAANVLAGTSTVTSGVSTVFNALTLKAINDNLAAATECEEALR